MMYSDKIMDHFRHPHNFGELKGADAVGKVGNPQCLIPETPIHHKDGVIPISEASKDSVVLSHNGQFNNILRIIARPYSDSSIEVKNKLGKNVLTPGHLVLAIKVPKERKYAYYKNKKSLPVAWYHAQDLEKGDLVSYPIMAEEKDTEYIYLKQKRKKHDYRSIKIPEKIKVDGSFLRLCGYYLAEGHLKEKVTKTYLDFAFHIDEVALAKDVTTIVKDRFGIDAKTKIIRDKKTLRVQVNNVWAVRLFKREFGKGANNKKIPAWIMALPAKKQKHLMYGLWMGDGYFNKRKPRAGYCTISYQLAQQIKTLLLRQKIIPSIYTEKERIIGGVKHRQAYRIHVGERNSLERLANILKIKLKTEKPIATDSWFDKNQLFIPITAISNINYTGKVHNLEVENAKSYVTNSLAVHNCGDLMHIYIKVGKNKSGKEILKDIKFQTFGCVAAIANSSMLTDMVKGKTLEWAGNLTKEDLLKELGKMPVVKYHCSVLAVDGLKDAIKKYREKNNGKK